MQPNSPLLTKIKSPYVTFLKFLNSCHAIFSCCPIFFVLFLDYYLEAHLICDLLDQTPSLTLLQWISAEDTTWAPSGLHPYCEDSRGWNQSSRRLFKREESTGSKRLFIPCLGRQQSQRNMHLIQTLLYSQWKLNLCEVGER